MRRLTLRHAVVAAVLVAALAFTTGLLAPSDAEAGFFCPWVTYYYSDGTYSQVVGANGTGCCGVPVNWGQVTNYRKCPVLYCTDIECPW
jgi:uncharacterized membrane protein